MRGSAFDDPGDEKSWHVSQRSEGLTTFFEGREPSWYASAIAPLKGADRVLDLGCGPGLTLEALLEQGCSSVLGIDRWPAFTANSKPAAPIVAHDLTLPMPFLESDSFDGVLSHYALDYVSPIGMRQVLREVHRVLSPGGLLVLYVAAVGLGSGDVARTTAYSPGVLQVLLDEAGFDEIEAEATPNGRNSVVRARATQRLELSAGRPEIRTSIEGDTQLSGSFRGCDGRIDFELTAPLSSTVFAFDLPSTQPSDETRVSVCARVQRSGPDGAELQVWAWRGHTPVVSHCARLEFVPAEMRVNGCGSLEHASTWSPGAISLEPLGNACARFGELSPGDDLSEAERGAEGRQIVVESTADLPGDVGAWLGRARNRLVVRRATETDLATIDREWLVGRAHGIALRSEELDDERMRELLHWAGGRGALVFLGGLDWEAVFAAMRRREDELQGPVVLIDPAVDSEPPRPLPLEVVTFAETHAGVFVLLSAQSRECSSGKDLARLSKQLLHGGSANADGLDLGEANETLRYLTERTLLMRLRQVHGHSPAEVGRREGLC